MAIKTAWIISALTTISLMGCAAQNSQPATPAPKITLSVRDFGAIGDGATKDTAAIQQAIDRCWILGGGEALVPAGNYLTGAISLKSNTTLRLDKDATLLGSPDFSDYPVTQVRWEGKWIQGHLGLIYAIDAHNIGIVGPGKIVGNPALAGRPSAQNPLRHPALIEPINCDGIHLEDFSTSYRSMWSIHPTYCQNIDCKNLTIRSTGGNGDGIDIDSCQHVRIDACDISTGDDCIAIKSGRGMEAYALLKTTQDVQITNCTFADSIFACIGIGSETSGGIRDIRIQHCKFTHAQTQAIYIKTRIGRGAFIEDITADDLDITGPNNGFLRLNLTGSGIQDQFPVPGIDGIPTTKNFSFSNIHIASCPALVVATEISSAKPLDGFSLTNVSGTAAKGISLANIQNADIKNINVTGCAAPLVRIFNVTGSGLENAGTVDAPKIPATIPAATQPFQLR